MYCLVYESFKLIYKTKERTFRRFVMSHSSRDWSKSDILYGIVIPIIIFVLIIVALSQVSYALGFSSLSGAVYGIIMELEELTVIVAVPLVLGLVWNKGQAEPQDF